jgi:hypothetical protein
MSELGDLLELLHGASRSFRSVRLEAREWRHVHRQQEAYERAVRQARGGVVQIMSVSRADDVPAELEVRLRAWFEQPNRVREEREEAGRVCVSVADGTRWWTRMPEWATIGEKGDAWAQGEVGHSIRPLLDPATLLATVELAVAGREARAGREAILVAASPRKRPHALDDGLLPHGADRHELAVDAERGLLLGATSFLRDEPFVVTEVGAIVLDEPIEAGVFSYEPAPGEQVARPDEMRPGEVVTIEDAARRASFEVLLPTSLGQGWRSHVLYTPGREGTRVSETVHLSLYRDDASHSISIRQTAGPFESWQTNGTEESLRDGRRVRVSTGPWHRVLVEQDGTHVELDSQTVETEQLLELALSLVPAPTEQPPLLG